MSVGIQLALFIGAFAASVVGVGLFRRWSRGRKLYDVPNERSSHTIPTPRGGGLVIVLVCLSLYLVIGGIFHLPFSWGYFCGALLVAVVSWIDDLYSLPFWSRLLVHLAAAAILISDVGFWSGLFIPMTATTLPLGNVLGLLLTVGWIVWFLNAYNFMDGIDGIAALQAAVAGVGWAVLASFLNLESTHLLSGIVAASSVGFLIHNWQPARIFMGDVGSAFLGFTLAAMPLVARAEARREIPVLPIVAVLFVWFFVFDTIFTFIKRLIARRRVWEAHREHIYQKLTIEGWPHAPVTLLYNSGAAVLVVMVLLSVMLSGIYPLLTFLSLTLLTLLTAYAGVRKKTLT
jgi:UDP-N-acetylmuramyl pentapeptide phosphotransferase/UDP-N-acetylglucosamine-1-phosphate transferase